MATVLIVDDAKMMRINIGNMLKELGHEIVAEATDGYMGVQMYKKHLPDFVTMDITMPCENEIKDGIEAVKAIKSEFAEAKIIMITSHGEQAKVVKAIQYGASNYILKPIQIAKFKEVVNKLLQ